MTRMTDDTWTLDDVADLAARCLRFRDEGSLIARQVESALSSARIAHTNGDRDQARKRVREAVLLADATTLAAEIDTGNRLR